MLFDEEDELRNILSVQSQMQAFYTSFVAANYRKRLNKCWIDIHVPRTNAQKMVGEFNTGEGGFPTTSFFLGGAHAVFAEGTFKARLEGTILYAKDTDGMSWEWVDEIDGKAWWERKRVEWEANPQNALAEGWWDIFGDRLAHNNFDVTIGFRDFARADASGDVVGVILDP